MAFVCALFVCVQGRGLTEPIRTRHMDRIPYGPSEDIVGGNEGEIEFASEFN